MKKRSILPVSFCLLFMLSLTAIPNADAQNANIPETVAMVAPSTTSTSYAYAMAIADTITKKTGTNVSLQSLGEGLISSMRALKDGRGDLLYTNTGQFYDAYFGVESMKKMGRVPVRTLFHIFYGGIGIIVDQRTGITKGEQLKGQKLYINFTRSPVMTNKGRACLKAYGLDPDRDVTILTWSSTDEFIDGILTKKAVGGYWALGGSKCQQLESTLPKGCRILPLPQDAKAMDIAHEADVSIIPGYVEEQPCVPEKTYVWCRTGTLGARADISDDLAYLVVKNCFENYENLKAAYRGFKYLSLEGALEPFIIPVHPGAIRYYKEKGIWTDKYDKLQAELLKKWKNE